MRKSNILIAGATGSGKTTFLEYLTCFFNEYENIAIIEDTRELAVSSCRPIHLVARQRGPELAEMLPYILRMTPDRIILGEMRSKEITPFILSMTSGHKGLMSTIHANDAAHSIERAALLFELYHPGTNIKTNVIHKLLAQNIDYIIYMKNKKIVEVVAPLNSENGNLAFRRVYSEGPSEGYASAMQFHH